MTGARRSIESESNGNVILSLRRIYGQPSVGQSGGRDPSSGSAFLRMTQMLTAAMYQNVVRSSRLLAPRHSFLRT